MVANLRSQTQTGIAAQANKENEYSLPRPEQLLFNRELSLVEFFRRVLDQARDANTPLLERLRFVGIFSSIIDEFFMIRVSALKEEIEEGWIQPSPDGMTPGEQLREIRTRLRPMFVTQMRCLRDEILPQLESEGIEIVSYDELSASERDEIDRYFEQNVFPVLTPLAVDPAHPFPYISGLSLNLGMLVEVDSAQGQIEKRFVRLKVPPVLPGLVRVGQSDSRFVRLSNLISARLDTLFPGIKVGTSHEFRVTRDADLDIREEEAEDLLHALQQELRRRRFGAPVRLEVSATMPDEMVAYLTESLGLENDDVYRIDGTLNVSDLMQLCELNRPALKYRSLRTTVPGVLRQKQSIFEVIKERDLLLHHPYVPSSIVTDFVRSAADDPNVLAIKICLYRTGRRSRLAEALIEAAERGKQVTALIELKARFDEENNIEWAQRLERAGVHVVYGVVGLKTHCKLTMVVRREEGAVVRYVHIATGNYNPSTSCTYTDLGLLTADEQIGADASEFFNYLTGYSAQSDYRRLLIAPVNLREKLVMLIEREADHARAGRPARITAKLNRVADPAIIQALYEASQAGISIDLIVRGICMLRPGVPGLSENIRVRQIVGRFLEHSRILCFANGGSDEVYIGSADWMPRNLNRRVEVVCPLNDPKLRNHLREVVLDAYLRDNVNAAELQPDGSYARVKPGSGADAFDSQMFFEGGAVAGDFPIN